MKAALTLLAGTAIGVILLYAWQGYQFQQFRNSSENSGTIYTDHSVDSQSFYISYDHALVVEDILAEEKYEVVFTPQPDGILDYSWIFLPDAQARGEGSLFEKYEISGIEPEKFTASVEDAGGSLIMSVGSQSIEWSQGSRIGGWLYYDPNLVALSVRATR